MESGKLHLLYAMAIRAFAAFLYIALVFLMEIKSGAGTSAPLVYVVAVCFVSSALGRVGTDQLISANAVAFRRRYGVKAASIYFSSLLFGAVAVPFAAMAIHAAIGYIGGSQQFGLPGYAVAAVSLFFSGAQTVSVAAMARGAGTLSVLIFPTLPFFLICSAIIAGETFSIELVLLAYFIAFLFGFLVNFRKIPINLAKISSSWIKKSLHYYLMGINFYIYNWAPFTFLQFIISDSDYVLLNLAIRISALQSMPSNAVSSYLMPLFSIEFKKGSIQAVKSIISNVVQITMVFQAIYIVSLLIIRIMFVDWVPYDIELLTLVLLVLSVGQLINGMTGPIGPALLMAGEQRKMAFVSSVSTITFIVTGIAGAYFGGAIGFAICTATMIIVQNAIYAVLLQRKTGISFTSVVRGALSKSINISK